MKSKNSILVKAFMAFFIIVGCEKNEVVSSSSATITGLSCTSASFSANATAGIAYTGTATVPYTGGNGAAYAAGSAVASTGVTGLTATLTAATLASGAGNATFAITGTPSAAGTAAFVISVGGQSCTLSLTVSASSTVGTTTDCSSKAGVEQIVCLADAFKATLSTTQIATLQLDYTFANIKTWSNLPAAMSARKGLKFSTLNSTQLAAAKALVEAMTKSSVANEGYDEVKQIWAADDWLVSDAKANSDYGSGNYYIAFFGTPSTSGTFEIMETGHHKTVANTYTNGTLVAATPHFVATEPTTWTTGGVTYAPVSQETSAMKALLASLNATQLATAKSSSSFTDIVLTPGKDWQFPTTYTGLVCSGLTDAQKALALNVIKTYTNDIDAASAAKFLALYTAELDKSYITYSGTGNMNTKNDYFRIDGPHVWIELSMNGGVLYSAPHEHSVWRDRASDYAGTTK